MQLAELRAQLVSCHRRADRSLVFRGHQFPVCARCTGIFAGYFAYPLFLLGWLQISFLICLAMQLPTIIDGYTQHRQWRTSTNTLRLATGILSGVGQAGLMVAVGLHLAKLVLSR